MLIEIRVDLKEEIEDPQGKVVEKALRNLGFPVKSVRFSKLIKIELDVKDEKEAIETGKQMCKVLLANPVIEKYTVKVIP
ncbi:phosphoribosylformylglycinamidine synthase subunit PurS [Thermococci archaeon]|nr:MAG: phosphoribosylformylglycinamidine synthase subunit PurS [Thermococci archaeon]RLF94111.1 MAG: phosphoribosylformylglycinamidine synthase subunit PurS [Thermococci archaeon]